MIMTIDREKIFSILSTDPKWSAYALADLDPAEPKEKEWFLSKNALILIYYGLEPPVVFAQGSPEEVLQLSRHIPSGRYYYTLMATHRALLGEMLRPEFQLKMWRMWHNPAESLPASQFEVIPLKRTDLDSIDALFDAHPDQPDTFVPGMLESNTYFGIAEGDHLVSIAGTHIISQNYQVAGVGNVFTTPQFRSRGMAQAVTAAVIEKLRMLDIRTIVLNVAMDNTSAIQAYRKIGFWPFVGYYEGIAAFN